MFGTTSVVYGRIEITGKNGWNYPQLYPFDIHIVLFFPTVTHFFVVVLLVVISGAVGTSIYRYHQKTMIMNDEKT